MPSFFASATARCSFLVSTTQIALGNDDAIRSIGLLTRVITDAIAAGLQARSAVVKEEAKTETPAVAAGEPLADWEKEVIDGAPTTPVEA